MRILISTNLKLELLYPQMLNLLGTEDSQSHKLLLYAPNFGANFIHQWWCNKALKLVSLWQNLLINICKKRAF